MQPNPTRPMMLGVVGDSATGKTTLSRGIADLLGADRVTHICCDDYHKYNRSQRTERGITPAHPDCNYIDIMAQHLALLRNGQPILKPVYDHNTGDFGQPEYVAPKEFVIVEGLLAYATPTLRDLFDLRIFLQPHEGLRRRWKIERDTAKRGYSRAQVLKDIAARRHDGETFIAPQRNQADCIVNFYPASRFWRSHSRLNVRLSLSHNFQRPPFGTDGLRATKGVDGGRVVDVVEIAGSLPDKFYRAISTQVRVDLSLPTPAAVLGSYVRGANAHSLQSRPLALTQLLLAYHLISVAADDAPMQHQTSR